MQGLNALKYFSTIVALVVRTLYGQKGGTFLQILAASTSGFTTIFNTYWDIVIDWGLLRRNSRNPWLRDKLLISNKAVYFVAMVRIYLLTQLPFSLSNNKVFYIPKSAVIIFTLT